MTEQKEAVEERDLEELNQQSPAKRDELAKLENRENAERHKVKADE